MMPGKLWSVVSAFLFAPIIVTDALAATQQVPSCYDLVKIEGVEAPAVQRELIVLIDQTVVIDDPLQSLVNQKIQNFLRAGDHVVIVTFSAYVRGKYSEIVLDGHWDRNLSEGKRFTTSKTKLEKLDLCLRKQESALRGLVVSHLKSAFESSSSANPKTELIGNMAALSREMIGSRQSVPTFIMVVSDMIENSDLTSFYAKGALRIVDPSAELLKAKQAKMLGTFDNASIYVVGAGYNKDRGYRSSKHMAALESFWRSYFESSGGRLKGFGAPVLIGEIGGN